MIEDLDTYMDVDPEVNQGEVHKDCDECGCVLVYTHTEKCQHCGGELTCSI